MKSSHLTAFLLILYSPGAAAAQELKVLPQPKEAKETKEAFRVDERVEILIGNPRSDESDTIVSSLQEEIKQALGVACKVDDLKRWSPKARSIVLALAEGSQEILQLIRSGECAAVINTPTLGRTVDRDGFLIRRAAVEARVPCLTSLDTALAVVTALRASAVVQHVAPLAEYRALQEPAAAAD